ncbi:MAG: hypothetical protein ABJA87_06990 [bacterium]
MPAPAVRHRISSQLVLGLRCNTAEGCVARMSLRCQFSWSRINPRDLSRTSAAHGVATAVTSRSS